MEVSRIPSPYEVEQNKTPNGGWTKSVLSSWGVPWPPPNGWKEALEAAHRSGQTLGVVLECVSCRTAKYFVDPDPYPICIDCQEREQKRYVDRMTKEFFIEQIERQSRVNAEYKKPTVIERISRRITGGNGYKKKPIPPEVRWAVWERDDFTCRHCGSRKNLSIDHIHPEVKGGDLSMDNLQTLCKSCNSRKGAR